MLTANLPGRQRLSLPMHSVYAGIAAIVVYHGAGSFGAMDPASHDLYMFLEKLQEQQKEVVNLIKERQRIIAERDGTPLPAGPVFVPGGSPTPTPTSVKERSPNPMSVKARSPTPVNSWAASPAGDYSIIYFLFSASCSPRCVSPQARPHSASVLPLAPTPHPPKTSPTPSPHPTRLPPYITCVLNRL